MRLGEFHNNFVFVRRKQSQIKLCRPYERLMRLIRITTIPVRILTDWTSILAIQISLFLLRVKNVATTKLDLKELKMINSRNRVLNLKGTQTIIKITAMNK